LTELIEIDYDQNVQKNGVKIPSFIEAGIKYGHIKEGYILKNYLEDAVANNGYETIGIHGVQGSGKSTLTLQTGADIAYPLLRKELGRDPTEQELWTKVLEALVFKPAQFINKLEAVKRNERLPFILWDDVGVHYTNTAFRLDMELYSSIDSMWAVIRTKVAICVVNIPLFMRLAKNIKDNLTFEVYVGRNHMVQVRRLFYLPGQKYIDENLFKPIIGEPYEFNIFDVPKWVWDQYWEMRLDLTEEALANLKESTDMGDNANWVPVKQVALELGKAASSIAQDVSRGAYEGKKIKGVMCIARQDYILMKDTWNKTQHNRLKRGVTPIP
jgi:hypothetical protein